MKNIKDIKNQFLDEYSEAFSRVNNHITVGISKENGDLILMVTLMNEKLKEILPTSYQGLKLNVKIISKVTSQ